MRFWAGSCTNRVESVTGKILYEIFSDDAPSGVACAENEEFEALFVHGTEGLDSRD